MGNKIREELRKMRLLIPTKGISIEERTERNRVVRKILPNLSNKTIFSLALVIDHQLSRNELIKRLDQGFFNNLRELFELADLLFSITVTKIIGKLIGKCFSEIKRVSLLASQEEIIEMVKIFNSTRMGRDSMIFEDMISDQSDAREILEKIESRKISNRLLVKYIEDKINTP